MFLCLLLLVVVTCFPGSLNDQCFSMRSNSCRNCSYPVNSHDGCWNAVRRAPQCFCAKDICLTKILGSGKTSFQLENRLVTSTTAQINCDWKIPSIRSMTPRLLKLDQIYGASNLMLIVNGTQIPIKQSDSAYLINSSMVNVKYSGKVKSTSIRATIHQGFCSTFDGFINYPWNIKRVPESLKLISSNNKDTKKNGRKSRCSWTMTAPQFKMMTLVFYTFQLDEQAILGVSSQGKSLGFYSNRNLPPPLPVSSQIEVTLGNPFEVFGSELVADILIDTCASDIVPLFGRSGSIFDGSSPLSTYQTNLNCRWILMNVNEDVVHIHFDYLFLYPTDAVEVFQLNGTDQLGKQLLKRFTDNDPITQPFNLSGNLLFEFVTSNSRISNPGVFTITEPTKPVPFYGFKLRYEVCDIVCKSCPPGSYYSSEINLCRRCPIGSVSTQFGSIKCQRCERGYVFHNSSMCRICDNGSIEIVGTCFACPSNYISINATNCSNCVNGTFSQFNTCQPLEQLTTPLFWYGMVMTVCLLFLLSVSGFFLWKKLKQKAENEAMYIDDSTFTLSFT